MRISKTKSQYRITPRNVEKFMSVACTVCGKYFAVGDELFRRKNRRAYYYHLSCAISKNFDLKPISSSGNGGSSN